MPTFDEQSEYNKHQAGCDCEDKSSCGCNNDCGCCPPGLVAVTDDNGNHVACLTPNDAACYEIESEIPPQGYVRVYSTGDNTGTFIGIMTLEDALAYYQGFGLIDAPVLSGQFNPTTVDRTANTLAVPGQGLFTIEPVDFIVDRITCTEDITLTFSGAKPAGLTFIGGASSIVIPSGQSIHTDGIQIDDTVGAGTYAVDIVYAGCSNNNTRTITVTVV